MPAPEDGAWQVEFFVARFEAREQRRFEAGKEVKGTVAVSEVVPKYAPTDEPFETTILAWTA